MTATLRKHALDQPHPIEERMLLAVLYRLRIGAAKGSVPERIRATKMVHAAIAAANGGAAP